MARQQRLEGELIASKQRARENDNAAAMIQGFINNGQMRVNESGKIEILDPKKMEAFEKVTITPKKQQQQK